MTVIAANLEAMTNLIWTMIEKIENPKAKNAIKRNIVGNKIKRTCQTYRQAILIFLKTVNIDAKGEKIRRDTGKRIL